MSSRWRWILVVAAATVLDLVGRFASSFDFGRVMHLEAVLFPATVAVLIWLRRSEPATRGWPNRARLGVIWLFGLGALRPLLWTLGAPIMVANLATLAVALAGLLLWAIRRRRRFFTPLA
jgi:hypothetical protein